MAIKTYQKGSTVKLSANFREKEFDCRGKGCCCKTLVDEQLVVYLQKIRNHFGAKVTVTSGYRCTAHNKKVGGASDSRHTEGMAADIKVEGVTPMKVAQYAQSIGVLGIGLYETQDDGYFVHIDTRTEKSFWYGQKELKRTTFNEDCFTLTMRKLAKGSQGEDVRALQKMLGCMADGKFGSKTEAAVKNYQEFEKLTADGIVGKLTMGHLLGVQSDE